MGFGVSKRLVDGRIADLPVFAGVSGSFDQARFEAFLTQNGMTETQLRRDIAQQLLAEQVAAPIGRVPAVSSRSEEHTSELQSLMRISYAVFCLKKKKKKPHTSRHVLR